MKRLVKKIFSETSDKNISENWMSYYDGRCALTNGTHYFHSPISRESIVFGSNFQSGDFDGFTLFEV